jgi:5,5'-dehydrodivanillate O-demethylase
MLFPNVLLVGNEMQATMQWRVPADDEHTFHVSYYVFRAAPGTSAPPQPVIPYRYVPIRDDQGNFLVDLTFNQDYMAWITQGPIVARDEEHLGESDTGILLFRRLLRQQLERALDGGEPMNVFREAADAISLPMERVKFGDKSYLEYSPAEAGESAAITDINRVLATWAAVREREPARS